MVIKQDFMDDSPEISLVQNRLTVAGLVLTALFFSGSFSLGLYAQFPKDTSEEFRIEFAQVLAPLAFGACLALLAIAGLLLCQQLSPTSQQRISSRRWWFSASTIWLYMASAQALSAGLTEVVFGISRLSEFVAAAAGIIALPAWVLLFFFGPIHLLREVASRMSTGERRSLVAACLVPLACTLTLTAQIYLLRSGVEPTLGGFLGNLLLQFIQPLAWSRPW